MNDDPITVCHFLAWAWGKDNCLLLPNETTNIVTFAHHKCITWAVHMPIWGKYESVV